MKHFLWKAFFLFFLIFAEVSLLHVLLPGLRIPLLLLVAVVVWTLVQGFPRSLLTTVSLTVLFDCIVSGGITIFSAYAVVLAYVTSFLSRRLLIERAGFGVFLYSFFAIGGVLGYQLLGYFRLFSPSSFSRLGEMLPPLDLSFASLFLTSFLGGLIFIILYPLVKRFEALLEYSALRGKFPVVK